MFIFLVLSPKTATNALIIGQQSALKKIFISALVH